MKRVSYYVFSQIRIVVLLLCSIASVQLMAQASVERTISCQCQDNSAPNGSAQFLEELTVNSNPEEVWYIASVSGLYSVDSPLPPEDQILFDVGPEGFILQAEDDAYTLQGFVIEDLDYSIVLTNGTDTVSMENVGCSYPKATIVGDDAICDGEIVTYTNVDYNPSFNYVWMISSKGSIISGGAGETLTVDWDDDATGFASIHLSFADENGCGGTVFSTVEFEEDIYMACNDLNNHTVGPECKVNVLPSDILEDMRFNDESYQLTLKLAETGEIIPLGSDADNYLFQQIEVSIDHLCGENSCWGYIQLEDKYIPDLVCNNDTIRCDKNGSPEALGFPIPPGVYVKKIGNQKYELKNFDGCSDVILTYVDEEENYHCSTDFYKRVARTWTASDKFDNTTTCTEYIYFTRTFVDDVVFPKNYDGIDYSPLKCTTNFPQLPNGMPDPSFTGTPISGVCGHLAIEYVDLPQQICEGTIKLVRKWKVFDPCTNQNKVHNQIIKIVDDIKPFFYCPPDFTFKIKDNTCTTDVQLPIPTDVTDCSSVTFSAKYNKLDDTGNIDGPVIDIYPINGQFHLNNLVEGRYKVEYFAHDDCGNTNSCSFYVTVKDQYAPVALCSSNSAVSLDLEGIAVVPVTTFDGGSFDNCSEVSLVGKRVNDLCGPNTWDEYITFCCADVGNEVDIQLKAIDKAGNYSICDVKVLIQDKKAPTINCPPTQILNCMDDKENLAQYGSPVVTDNCAMEVEESVSYNLNNCGTGFIYRNFKVVDAAGNQDQCTQALQYLNSNPVLESDITWPLDYSVDVCNTASLAPDSLPQGYRKPIFPNVVCSELGISHYDNVYTNNGGYCQSIHRKWTIIDKCSSTHFYHTQKIYISDDEKPVFDECSDKVLDVQALPNCTYQAYYKKEATDNCTPKNKLKYSYDIDLNNDGYLEIWKAGNIINQELPAGTHKVIWKVEDQCGNFKVCTEYITIKDLKPPTPYCINGISTVVMESTGSIEIWASDFNHNSTDNCSEKEDLVYSFSKNSFNKTKVFTCADLDGNDEKLFNVDVYVHDESGNYDYCTTTIKVTSNGYCDGSTIEYFDMSGVVRTIDSELMPNVDLQVTNMDNESVVSTTTNEEGTYSFANLQGFMPYEITAHYPDGDPLNGVSTLDIVLIQKHILGIEKLEGFDKIIAADVNKSGTITGSDIVQLRKLLLGLIEDFPENEAWRFVDAYADYPDPNKPFPVQEKVKANPLKEDMMQSDLVSIKVGDVNLTRQMNFSSNPIESRSKLSTTLNYRTTKYEDITLVDFYIDETADVEGIQFTLDIPKGVIFNSIREGSMDINESNYHVDTKNQLRFSWSGEKRLKTNDVLFSMEFGNEVNNELTLANSILHNEIYLAVGSEIVTSELFLERRSQLLNSSRVNSDELILLDAKPNPFSDVVKISFVNPFEGAVSLVLRDINGKTVYNESQYFSKGNNEWNVDCNTFHESGMLIYSISTARDTKSGKVLRIK